MTARRHPITYAAVPISTSCILASVALDNTAPNRTTNAKTINNIFKRLMDTMNSKKTGMSRMPAERDTRMTLYRRASLNGEYLSILGPAGLLGCFPALRILYRSVLAMGDYGFWSRGIQ
jgi:hypothetical protein